MGLHLSMGGGFVFQGGASFLSGGGTPWGGISFDGGVQKKSLDGGGDAPHALHHYGKPWSLSIIARFDILLMKLKGYTFI